jgi:hypothetical protein
MRKGGELTLQLSETVRNSRLDAIILAITATPVELKIYSGTPPANCEAIDEEDVLVTIVLPSPYMLASSAGIIAKTGTWEDTSAELSGTAGHFRIIDSGGDCYVQGTVSLAGNGGDLILGSLSITAGQDVIVDSFTITDGNV